MERLKHSTSEREASPVICTLTFTLVAIATVAVDFAIASPDQRAPLTAIEAGTRFAAAGLAARWLAARGGQPAARTRTNILFLFALGAAPVIWACIAGAAGRGHTPLEIILFCGCRNLLLGLFAISGGKSHQRLLALLGLFLVLFTSSAGSVASALVIIAAYAVLGCIWLMALNWTASGRGAVATHRGGGFPIASAAVVIFIVSSAVFAAAMRKDRAVTALRGLIPSSGGDRSNSDLARNGVGSGIDQVSGSNDPKAVGYDNSDVFVNSEKCSMYDSFVERYGESVKPTEFKKMIFLRRSELKTSTATAAEDYRSGRKFSLFRQLPSRTDRAAEHAAQNLLYVSGRTPLHLRMKTYAGFDGASWSEETLDASHHPAILKEAQSRWMRPEWEETSAAFSDDDDHQIFIGKLDSHEIPVPPHLRRFRMGRVDRPDFFALGRSATLQLTRRNAPAGTVIETLSRTVNPSRLHTLVFVQPSNGDSSADAMSTDAARLDSSLVSLAQEWVAGVPRGWGQVEAVIDQIRRRCTLDSTVRDSTAEHEPIADFLFRTRRGPDYMFATSATLMLRALGYPARLVSGFYADPEKYDASTDKTPLTSSDVHFWSEVRLPDGTWVDVEPTPGYHVAGPKISWTRRAADGTWRWMRSHSLSLGAALIGLLLTIYFRAPLSDLALTLGWLIRDEMRPSDESRVLSTLRLIERRLWLTGQIRPAGVTPRRWLASSRPGVPPTFRDDLLHLTTFTDWAIYAPQPRKATPWTRINIRRVCRRLVLSMTVTRLYGSTGRDRKTDLSREGALA